MSIWTEFLQDKKFEIKDDYGIFLHKFKTPMLFSTERDLMTYLEIGRASCRERVSSPV